MKKALLIVLPALLLGCSDKSSLKDDKSKYSYAIGHQIGRNIKIQNVDLDYKAFNLGLKKAADGKEALLTDEEMMTAMRSLNDKQRENETKAAAVNKEAGAKFLAENKGKEGVQATASGLQYKVVKMGNGKKPKPTDTVEVHYAGKLTNGTEFDSSYARNRPAEFPVNAVIPGWTEALQLMPVGSKFQLFIPSELGYGDHGNAKIPGGSVLVFDVELLSIKTKK